jgi:hypothetical protein
MIPPGMRPIPDAEAEMERLAALRKEPPPLTPDQARALLRECVTVVKPGETLIVRANENWTPRQVREIQDFADTVSEYRELGVKILFLPGEEFAVAKAAE